MRFHSFLHFACDWNSKNLSEIEIVEAKCAKSNEMTWTNINVQAHKIFSNFVKTCRINQHLFCFFQRSGFHLWFQSWNSKKPESNWNCWSQKKQNYMRLNKHYHIIFSDLILYCIMNKHYFLKLLWYWVFLLVCFRPRSQIHSIFQSLVNESLKTWIKLKLLKPKNAKSDEIKQTST